MIKARFGVALLATLLGVTTSRTFAQQSGAKPHAVHRQSTASSFGFFDVNRVVCNVDSNGSFCAEICCDVAVAGWWPKQSPNDRYIFSAGPTVAGIIGADGGPWAGDTTGAFFFDLKGSTLHGQAVTPVNNARTADSLDWPEAARVPTGSAGALFHPSLQGRISASEGDVWWLSWEADSLLLSGRPHPLGLVMEVRGMGWNGPGANEDITYFLVTYYNITSTDPADYATAPAALRPILLARAQEFQAKNNARFGITLPAGGYTITSAYAGMEADIDISDAGSNYASVNVPLSMSLGWNWKFGTGFGFELPPLIFSPPFYAGSGLTGIKFLNAPGMTPGSLPLTSFSDLTGSSTGMPAPRDAAQLFRYMALGQDPQLGDNSCDFAPSSHICFIQQTASDIKHYQGAGPFTLAPGQSATSALAFLFAAPYRTGTISTCPSCNVSPGSSTIIAGLADPAIVAAGVNPIDSIAGFLGASDLSGDGVLQGDEFLTAPRSLYAKAQIAQAMFDHQFLVPSAPSAPDFFLIPGDGQVTVMWRPSATEQTGDPFFTVAHDALTPNPSGVLVPNPLYDPNFRQFDVEGYRIYRARVDDPASLTLLAQFDYAGTIISDYQGQVNPNRLCAPELGAITQCPITYDPAQPGQARVAHVDISLVGSIVQVQLGDRIALSDGTGLELRTDTTSGPGLNDTGVPFSYVDHTVRNNFRYFYAVTAFDINSRQSGPSSFESLRITKNVTPAVGASNHENTASISTHIVGRGVAMDTIITQDPTIDPVTGTFSGPARPADGLSASFLGFVKDVIATSGSFAVRLDSITPGQADLISCCGGVAPGVPAVYHFTAHSPSQTTRFSIPLVMPASNFQSVTASVVFDAVDIDQGLASRFGGNANFALKGTATASLPNLFLAGSPTLGCRIAGGFPFPSNSTECIYNGPRWRNGPTTPTASPLPADRLLPETFPDPNSANCNFFGGNDPVCQVIGFNNAGHLAGVDTVYTPQSFTQLIRRWRNVESVLGPVFRAADMNLYWGANGRVDSVIDVTHNVPVDFSPTFGASWGILNADNPGTSGSSDTRLGVLTANDFTCIAPINNSDPNIPLTNPTLDATNAYPCSTTAALSNTATLGSIAFYKDAQANAITAPVSGNGFLLYLAGTVSMFQLPALPAAGTVWTLRTYGGFVTGGQGIGGGSSGKPYDYNPGSTYPAQRPMTAVGAEVEVTYTVVNNVIAPTPNDLSQVHTVPDPYYLSNSFEADAGAQVIKFVNLPQDAVIRIYSSSGVLVTLLEHHSATFGGTADWNVRNRTGRRVASGVYFYHLEAGNARRAGRFIVVNDRPGF